MVWTEDSTLRTRLPNCERPISRYGRKSRARFCLRYSAVLLMLGCLPPGLQLRAETASAGGSDGNPVSALPQPAVEDAYKRQSIGHLPARIQDYASRPGDGSVQDSYFDWLSKRRDRLSTKVNRLGRVVDQYLGGKQALRYANGSYVRVGAFGRYGEAGDIEFDPRFKFRLDLPATKEEYRFVIENDSPDALSTQERNRQRVLQELETVDRPASGFFRLLLDQESWELSTDVGVRFNSGPTAFVRGRANRQWEFAPLWTFTSQSETTWFVDTGLGFDQAFILDRQVSAEGTLRLYTDLQWRAETAAWNFAEVFSYTHILDFRSYLAPAIGWSGQNQPRLETTAYFANVTWRRRIHSNWLFLEIVPEVAWLRETGFGSSASLTVGLEVLFME